MGPKPTVKAINEVCLCIFAIITLNVVIFCGHASKKSVARRGYHDMPFIIMGIVHLRRRGIGSTWSSFILTCESSNSDDIMFKKGICVRGAACNMPDTRTCKSIYGCCRRCLLKKNCGCRKSLQEHFQTIQYRLPHPGSTHIFVIFRLRSFVIGTFL